MSYSLARAEQRRKELYAKQSRGSEFQTREQRDNWIKGEIRKIDSAIKQKRDQVSLVQRYRNISTDCSSCGYCELCGGDVIV